MKITDKHLKILDPVIAPEAFSGFAVSISDQAMRLCQRLLDECCEPEALEWIKASLTQCLEAEYEWRTVPMSLAESFLRDTHCIYQTLYALLAPVYAANGQHLPRLRPQDLNAVLRDPALRDLTTESIIQGYGKLNPAWPAYIRPSFKQLQRVVTRQLIWVITEAFFRKIPKALG